MKHTTVNGFMMAALLGLALSGCAGTSTNMPIHQLEVRGESVADAKRQAMQQAKTRCQGRTPVVLDGNTLNTGPTFTATSAVPPAQSEVADYEATTHEGERPVVRWHYRCE